MIDCLSGKVEGLPVVPPRIAPADEIPAKWDRCEALAKEQPPGRRSQRTFGVAGRYGYAWGAMFADAVAKRAVPRFSGEAMRHVMLAFFAALVVSLLVAPASAQRRVALVIGNSAYREVSALPNRRHDAEDVAAALKRIGFETIVGLDLDNAGTDDMTISFARAARTADIAVIYYSGHARQYSGVNYLAPIDARLADETDLRRMTRVDEIVADLQQAKTLRILVLDSCRDNPLAEQLKRAVGPTRAPSIQRGLAKIDSPEGMIISYATQAGRTAADGVGRNSPYTSAFLKHIEEQEEIGTIFRTRCR